MELTNEQLASVTLRPASLEAITESRAEFITRDGRRAKFVYHLEEGAEYYKLYWHVPGCEELVSTSISGRYTYSSAGSLGIFQVPVGIVEGKAVYPGDRLYWEGHTPGWVTATYQELGGLDDNDVPGRSDSSPNTPNGFPYTYLSWTKPVAITVTAEQLTQEQEPDAQRKPSSLVVMTADGFYGPFTLEEAKVQAAKLGGFFGVLRKPDHV